MDGKRTALTVDVEARLTVSDDTAIACGKLLDIYCDNRVESATPGEITCKGCVLCQSGYCYKMRTPVYVESREGI